MNLLLALTPTCLQNGKKHIAQPAVNSFLGNLGWGTGGQSLPLRMRCCRWVHCHIWAFYCGSILNAVLVHSSLTCSPLEPGTEPVEEGECCQAGRGEKVSNETICEFVLAVATSFSSIVNLIFNSPGRRCLPKASTPTHPPDRTTRKYPFPNMRSMRWDLIMKHQYRSYKLFHNTPFFWAPQSTFYSLLFQSHPGVDSRDKMKDFKNPYSKSWSTTVDQVYSLISWNTNSPN